MRKRIIGLTLLLGLTLSACGEAPQDLTPTEESTNATSTENVDETEQLEYGEDSVNLNKTYTLEDLDKAFTDTYTNFEIVEFVDDDTTYYTIYTKDDDYMYYEVDTEHYVTNYKLNTSSIIHKFNDTDQEVYLYLEEDGEPFIVQHYTLDNSKIADIVETETDLNTVKDTFQKNVDTIINQVKEGKTSCQYQSTDLIVHDYYDIVTVWLENGDQAICYINAETGVLDAIEYSDGTLTYVLTNLSLINTDLYEYKEYKESEYANLADYFKFNYDFVKLAYTRNDSNLFESYEKELEDSNITIDKTE